MPVTPLRLLSLALLLAAALPARAETPPPVDETALRYYASRNETRRVEAEIRRLRALYPDWQVPENLALPTTAANPEQPLWDLFAKDDLDGLDAAIAARRAADPAFRPSVDLSAKLEAKRARRDLLAAAAKGDDAAVVRLAGAAGIGGCADLEVAWATAAARARSGDRAGAESAFGDLLVHCDDAGGRRASALKAMDALGAEAARRLVASAVPAGSADAAVFADLAPVFARSLIAAAIADPAAPRPTEADVAAVEAHGEADDLVLAGWWWRGVKKPDASLAAFEKAEGLLPAGDARLAETVEGRVLALDDLGRRDEAVATARAHRGRSPEIRRLFVDLGAARFDGDPRPVLDAGEIADYAAATEEARSAVGAATLGWYALAFGEADLARRWFETALGYEPAEDAAKGAVLAAAAMGDRPGAATLKATWAARFPALADLSVGAGAPAKAAARSPVLLAWDRKDYGGCVAAADRAAARRPLPADLSLIHGWCLLKLGRPTEAETAFAAAAAGKRRIREDAVYGRALALFAAGRPEEAASVASAISGDAERRNEIGVAVLADRAIALFNARRWADALATLDQRARFAPEPTDLSILRGWALVHLGERAKARALFRSIDALTSTRASRAALAELES